jgi:hypothetical protein
LNKEEKKKKGKGERAIRRKVRGNK